MDTSTHLVEERIAVGGGEIVIERPRDFEDLLSDEAFEREELLPYWAHLWGSSVALAGSLGGTVRLGARVLELGCGLGLASIAAARAGARVTASDWSEDATAAAAANAARNGAELEVLVADWDTPGELLRRAPWDLVIAADVLYEAKKVTTLLELLPRLTDLVLLAEPGRATAEPFFERVGRQWDRSEVEGVTQPRTTVHRLRRRPQRA